MPEWFLSPFIFGAGFAVVTFFVGVGIWIGSVNSDRKSFKEFMKEVREDIKKILDRLPAQPVAGHSPVQLTEFGKKISRTVEVPKWAEKHAPSLVSKAKGKEEFEIFEACIEYVEKEYKRDSEFTKIVHAGAYNVGTEPSNVLKVFNVVLRDHVVNLLP